MTAKTHLLYDDTCPMCTFQMKVITWLDWFNRIHLVPASSPEVQTIVPELTHEQLMAAIHSVGPDGRIQRGARALRFVGIRLPPMMPLAALLWFPGVIWIAERVYTWISRNRHVISKLFGCHEACQLMPVRSREKLSEHRETLDN